MNKCVVSSPDLLKTLNLIKHCMCYLFSIG
uniref:Uncharacterized protein n=1 Tax=Anguilla anguilla TaxID=7936 RepID=A0A0E9RL36_ANGAN